MIIPLGTDDWLSASENFQHFRMHNMYLTDNPTAPDGASRVSRPTLTSYLNVGTGPIYGIWRQENTLSGDWFVVSGIGLYRIDSITGVSTLLGPLIGVGFCQFAGSGERVIVVRDGVAYSTDGVTITVVLMPNDVDPWTPNPASVGSVAVINSYFILTVLNTQRFYWISPGDTDPDPLNFASAERVPDSIVSVHILSDEIWFVGASAPEVWSTTGDDAAPFQRINGRVYSDGCAFRDTSINVVYNSLPAAIWVSDTRSVVLAQGQVTKISNPSVEELLRGATTLRAWFFRHNRHDFYILTSDTFTLAYDLTRNGWSRWDTYLQDTWQAHLGLQSGFDVYAGDSLTGNLWKLEEGESDNGNPVIREVSGTIDHPGKYLPCSNVFARVNAGWSPTYGFQPSLELRWSDDQGATWSDYMVASLGDKGIYSTDVTFRSLGMIFRPGRTFEFRFADIARFRLDYASMNEEG